MNAGDHIIVRQSESGLTWTAKIDRVTDSGRVVAWWHRKDRSGGVPGEPTKPRALDPHHESIVRRATAEEAAAFDAKPQPAHGKVSP